MSNTLWFTNDLANLLRGIALAALSKGDIEYQAGFQDALVVVAVTLGIPVNMVTLTSQGARQ